MTSIRRNLTRNLLVAIAAPLVVAGALTHFLIRDEMIEQFDAGLSAQALALAAVTRVRGDGGADVEASAHVMRSFDVPEERDGDDEGVPAVFQIRQLNGASIARSAALGTADLPVLNEPARQLRFWNVTLPSGVAGRAVGFSFRPESSERRSEDASGPPDFVMVTAVDRRDLDQTIQKVALLLTGCGVLLLGATFVVVPRVVRREFVPVEALAEQASRITASSLQTRFPTDRLPAELVPIGLRLNDLLGRLETSFERERRFSADLAHELRTPLAELRSLAELVLKWPESRPADTDRDVLAIATQMESVVERLLAIHRSEHGQIPIAKQPIDLQAMFHQTWQPLDTRATEKALAVTWHVPPGQVASTDPVLLRVILSNLLRNSVEYTPAGGEISVDVRAQERGLTVQVRNSAPELSPDDVARLFDRFWRRDAARSESEHAGLGLSLARAVTHAMGGELSASQDARGVLEMTLALPS